MWLWRARVKNLPAIPLLKHDRDALRSVRGKFRRPDRTETIPLMDYIKSLFRLGERAERERPERGRPGRLEGEGPAVKRSARGAADLDLVGKGQEVPFRAVRQRDRTVREVLEVDADGERPVGAGDRLADPDGDAVVAAADRALALEPEDAAVDRRGERGLAEVPRF